MTPNARAAATMTRAAGPERPAMMPQMRWLRPERTGFPDRVHIGPVGARLRTFCGLPKPPKGVTIARTERPLSTRRSL